MKALVVIFATVSIFLRKPGKDNQAAPDILRVTTSVVK